MSVTLRFSALALSRGRVATRAPIPLRTFTTSQQCLKARVNRPNLPNAKTTETKAAPTAKNDLSAEEGDRPPVNTEAPFTSRDPAPDNAPASSAEVPPNNAMPPPAPREGQSAPPPPPFPKANPAKTDTSRAAKQSGREGMEELMASISVDSYSATGKEPGKETPNYTYDASSASRPKIDLDAMISSHKDSFMSQTYDAKNHDPLHQPLVRTAPVSGRTVFVDVKNPTRGKMATPEQGFKRLDVVMGQNKIKTMFHAQKFFERPGMKKKRLKMLRWKRKFRYGFIETTRRVKELKKQGW